MRIEAAFFLGVTTFFLVLGAIYWFTSYEPAGTMLLVGSGLLGLLAGVYLLVEGRGATDRPEDDPDATVADGAGPVGWFPTASWWPFVVAAGATTFATGLVLGVWVALLGAVGFAVGLAGIVVESRRAVRGARER